MQTSPRASSLVALFPISKPQPLVSGPQKVWCCNRTHGFRIHSPFSHFASHFFLPFPDTTSFSFTFPPAIRWRICNGWELQLPLTNVFVNNNNNIKRMDSKCLPETSLSVLTHSLSGWEERCGTGCLCWEWQVSVL